jgi:hypothetical protein
LYAKDEIAPPLGFHMASIRLAAVYVV